MPLFGLVQARAWIRSSIWILSVASILQAHGRQTCLDKLGDLINTTPMFSDIKPKTSPQLPSRFEDMYKFCVDIQPDFPVPYLTFVHSIHAFLQSFPRGFCTVDEEVSTPSAKVSTCNALSCLYTFCFAHIG